MQNIVGKLERIGFFEDLGIDGCIILTQILNRICGLDQYGQK
jgi:hypothetical protein